MQQHTIYYEYTLSVLVALYKSSHIVVQVCKSIEKVETLANCTCRARLLIVEHSCIHTLHLNLTSGQGLVWQSSSEQIGKVSR